MSTSGTIDRKTVADALDARIKGMHSYIRNRLGKGANLSHPMTMYREYQSLRRETLGAVLDLPEFVEVKTRLPASHNEFVGMVTFAEKSGMDAECFCALVGTLAQIGGYEFSGELREFVRNLQIEIGAGVNRDNAQLVRLLRGEAAKIKRAAPKSEKVVKP